MSGLILASLTHTTRGRLRGGELQISFPSLNKVREHYLQHLETHSSGVIIDTGVEVCGLSHESSKESVELFMAVSSSLSGMCHDETDCLECGVNVQNKD